MLDKKETFSRIYDQCVEKIYRFVFLKVSSQEVAEDLTSQAFLKGWEKVKDGEQIENPQAFLYRIARNLVTDYYRERARNQTIAPAELASWNDPIDPGNNLEANAILDSDIETIKTALSGLNDDYQNAVIWHYLDDLSICEVAKLLDRTEPATRVLLHRAISSLRKQLA